MPTATKNIHRRTTAIRRNEALHQQICEQITNEQERVWVAFYLKLLPLRNQLINRRTI